MAASKDMQRVLDRLAALESEKRHLKDEVAALRRAQEPPQPEVGPRIRELPGQGGPTDIMGNRIVGQAEPSQTTVGGNVGFGSPYINYPDGTRVFAPDGVPRDPQTGKALTLAAAEPVPVGPVRTHTHQAAIDTMDAWFPVGPAKLQQDGEA